MVSRSHKELLCSRAGRLQSCSEQFIPIASPKQWSSARTKHTYLKQENLRGCMSGRTKNARTDRVILTYTTPYACTYNCQNSNTHAQTLSVECLHKKIEMVAKDVLFVYAEPRSSKSVASKVCGAGDSISRQATKAQRLYQNCILQRKDTVPGRIVKCPATGDNSGMFD